MRTFTNIILAFGGPAKYAEALSLPAFHARTMKQRDSIPPAYWADTVDAARKLSIQGVTLDLLAQIAKTKRPHALDSQAVDFQTLETSP